MKLLIFVLFLAEFLQSYTKEPKSIESYNQMVLNIESVYNNIFSARGGSLLIGLDKFSLGLSTEALDEICKETSSLAFVTSRNGIHYVVIDTCHIYKMTIDGVAMTICHEIGHILAGYLRAAEGEADYYSAHICARAIWENQPSNNKKYREIIREFPDLQETCNTTYQTDDRQNLCYRIALASLSKINQIKAIGETAETSLEAKDNSVTPMLSLTHPRAQCRLDTMINGAVCSNECDINYFPKTYQEMMSCSCENTSFDKPSEIWDGARPLCWFNK